MAETQVFERPERRDAPMPTARLGFKVVALLIGIVLLVGVYAVFSPRTPLAPSVLLQSSITPSPEVSSGKMLHDLRATEDALLNTYGWLDKQKGIVHIPITQAIDLLVQRGLPTRKQIPRGVMEF